MTITSRFSGSGDESSADHSRDGRRDFEEAQRGFVGTIDPPTIRDAAGEVVWDLTRYSFLDAEVPDTAHPSLWRLAQLKRSHGLFQVTDKIYQVRGFDIANMSIIEGDAGFLVIDPLTCVETASAAMALVREHLGDRPVTGMIFTHSHIDHFGGAAGVVDPEDARSGRVPVIAPRGFAEHAVSEHIHAGVAVSRRSQFMFGRRLDEGPEGQIGAGLGFTLPTGRITLLEPNREVGETGAELIVDGVRLAFQFTPGAEAPAEFNIHLPDLQALCMAENVSHHMHNLYTLRGAQVRDALLWSAYLDEAVRLYGDRATVMFLSHHWPVRGRENIVEHIAMHRDLYRYIHDETLRLANHGHTPAEIAEEITLPEPLGRFRANRGCYGTLNHNVKAVYQRYLGWFDGNPANLHPLPPAETGTRYTRLLGGQQKVLAHAEEAYRSGDYRWAAELLKHALAAEPDHAPTRQLQAEVFTQLGFKAESGPWRNFYLLAAAELRGDATPVSTFNRANAEMAAGMTSAMLLDFLAIRLHGPRAASENLTFQLRLTDTDERLTLTVANGLLHHRQCTDEAPETVLTLAHETLARLALGTLTLAAAEQSGRTEVTGDRTVVERTFALLDEFSGAFSVVAPDPPPMSAPSTRSSPDR